MSGHDPKDTATPVYLVLKVSKDAVDSIAGGDPQNVIILIKDPATGKITSLDKNHYVVTTVDPGAALIDSTVFYFFQFAVKYVEGGEIWPSVATNGRSDVAPVDDPLPPVDPTTLR